MPIAGVHEHDSPLGRWRVARWTPAPPLAGTVAEMWDLESHGAYTRERMAPRPNFVLLINLGEAPHRRWQAEGGATIYRRSWVAGLQDRFLDVESPPDTRMMGVMLTPTGARRIIGLPAAEFTNRVVDFPDVVGPAFDRLRERLHDTPSVDARFQLLEHWLVGRLAAARGARPAVDAALSRLFSSHGGCRVRGLARDLGMSQKHLIHLFHDDVGLPPKTLARVIRFNALVRYLHARADADLTDTAHRFHYFDYSHFARECREFTGSSPTAFLRARGPDGDTVVVE